MSDFTTAPLENQYESQIVGELSSSETAPFSLVVNTAPGFTLSSGSVYAVLEPGTSKEEGVNITAISGTTLTVGTRGLPTAKGGAATTTSHGGGSKIIFSNNWQTFDDIATAIATKVDGTGDTMTGQLNFSGTTHAGIKLISLTTSERTALSGANGMMVYDETLGLVYQYINGGWASVDTGTSYTAGDGLTLTAQDFDVDTSDTTVFVKTSSGAGDEDKVATLGSDGKFATGFVPSGATNVDVQTFSGNGTWTKPTDPTITTVKVVMWGAGGGGGGGEGAAAASQRFGGTGGGGGARQEAFYQASDLGSTVSVTVGAGGTGGAGGSSAEGANGVAGGNTTFGSLLTAYGGGPGINDDTDAASGGGGGGSIGAGGTGGEAAASAGGAPGDNTTTSAFAGQGASSPLGSSGAGGSAEYGGGGGGGYNNSGPTARTGGTSIYGGGGGGAGGNVDNGNTERAAAAGGDVLTYGDGGGGTAGAVNGGAGGAGAAGDSTKGGQGGGGGGAQDSGTGGVGGAGGTHGGGGGGGGGGTTTGGAGGAGGDGYVYVYSW